MHNSEEDNRDLKILFISTSYPSDDKDWRGRFTANLVDAISSHNDVNLSIWAPPGAFPNRVKDASLPTEAMWLKALMAQGGIAHILRTKGIRSATTILRLLLDLRRVFKRSSAADLVHINWLQNALPLWGIEKPAIISVLGSDYRLLHQPGMAFLLRSVLKRRKCILAPNAGWMAPLLDQVFGDIAEIRPISFGVDQRWFEAVRKSSENNLSRWIAVTRITPAKIGTLFDWGKNIFGKQHEMHLIGPMQEKMFFPNWVFYHGPASPDELCENWFPHARGLITLSQHDEGRPQVILEAMAAGLPVIASDISAHRDVINHQETGWIAKSAEDFKNAISLLNNPGKNNQIGQAARKWVAKNIGTWHDCSTRYIDAYRDLLEDDK
ncbi:MAG: glycosyltransferase family 4 protein [Desulfobacteraceae bacterium]|nr:glycosyltransferase family 4 protein [Desulfobacteraceae bacterium]